MQLSTVKNVLEINCTQTILQLTSNVLFKDNITGLVLGKRPCIYELYNLFSVKIKLIVLV